ncbi:hypothetical protein LQW54_007190 [Pestalotiopsis sp. IQ-011]
MTDQNDQTVDDGTESRTSAPLNPDRRPQRLYHKIKVAMAIVYKRIHDEKFNEIGLDANFDSWPLRAVQDYRPEVRRAILKAVENHWEMFNITNNNDDIGPSTDDEFVLGELIYDAFYDE